MSYFSDFVEIPLHFTDKHKGFDHVPRFPLFTGPPGILTFMGIPKSGTQGQPWPLSRGHGVILFIHSFIHSFNLFDLFTLLLYLLYFRGTAHVAAAAQPHIQFIHLMHLMCSFIHFI